MTLSLQHAGARALVAVSMCAVVGAACEPQEEQGGTLDNGTFDYACVSTADPECPDDLSTTPTAFPTIALGGTFSLVYSSNGSTDAVTVVAASSDFFLSQGQSFTAIRSGEPSFFAEDADGTILDFTQVEVVPITRIEVKDTTQSFSSPGIHTFTGSALGAVSEPLAGVVAYEWESSDPTVLAIQGGQATPATSINAVYLKHGTAKLTAKSGDATGSITIDVNEGQ